jgi:hypothetical protein
MEAQQPREGSKRDSAISIDSNADDPAPLENKLLLVYPFKFNKEKLQEIFPKLTKLAAHCFGIEETIVEVEEPDNGAEESSLRDYLIIREDDRERLRPKTFFNHTIVDFWMSWNLSYFGFALYFKPALRPFDLKFISYF